MATMQRPRRRSHAPHIPPFTWTDTNRRQPKHARSPYVASSSPAAVLHRHPVVSPRRRRSPLYTKSSLIIFVEPVDSVWPLGAALFMFSTDAPAELPRSDPISALTTSPIPPVILFYAISLLQVRSPRPRVSRARRCPHWHWACTELAEPEAQTDAMWRAVRLGSTANRAPRALFRSAATPQPHLWSGPTRRHRI